MVFTGITFVTRRIHLHRPIRFFKGSKLVRNSGNYLLSNGSSVGITTDYGLDGPGSNPGGNDIFRPSRPALGPTQPAVEWAPAFPGGKVRPGRAADHSPPLVPRSWKSRTIPLPTLRACPGIAIPVPLFAI